MDASLFLIVESWTLNLIEASEACSSLDVFLGSLMTSWMSRHCALGVILVGQPLMGRFTTVPSFLHLWIMALTVVRWSPKALEWLYNPFQTDTCQLFCFSSVLESWHDVCSLRGKSHRTHFSIAMHYFSIVFLSKHTHDGRAWPLRSRLTSLQHYVFKTPCQVKRISTFTHSAAHQCQFQSSGPIRRTRRQGKHCELLFAVASWHNNCFIWRQHDGGGAHSGCVWIPWII